MRNPDAQAEPRGIPERPMLRGERIWLRPLEERDMPAYAAGINDTAVGIPAGYRWPMSADHARAWLERQQDSVKRGDAFLYATCELGDDRFIGTTWLHEVSWLDGSAELAIYMDHDHLGAGWGTRCAAHDAALRVRLARADADLAHRRRGQRAGHPLIREGGLPAGGHHAPRRAWPTGSPTPS